MVSLSTYDHYNTDHTHEYSDESETKLGACEKSCCDKEKVHSLSDSGITRINVFADINVVDHAFVEKSVDVVRSPVKHESPSSTDKPESNTNDVYVLEFEKANRSTTKKEVDHLSSEPGGKVHPHRVALENETIDTHPVNGDETMVAYLPDEGHVEPTKLPPESDAEKHLHNIKHSYCSVVLSGMVRKNACGDPTSLVHPSCLLDNNHETLYSRVEHGALAFEHKNESGLVDENAANVVASVDPPVKMDEKSEEVN